MYKDGPSEVFTLEDIIKEFGSGSVSASPAPAAPAAPIAPEETAPVTPAAKPMPQKGTIPFQTSRLPKIPPEELARIEMEQTQLFRPMKEPETVAETPVKPSRKERKAAKAAEKEANRRAREAKKEAAAEAKWAAKEAKRAARKQPVAAEPVSPVPAAPAVEKSAPEQHQQTAAAPVEPVDPLDAIIREFSAKPAAPAVMTAPEPQKDEPVPVPAAKEEITVPAEDIPTVESHEEVPEQSIPVAADTVMEEAPVSEEAYNGTPGDSGEEDTTVSPAEPKVSIADQAEPGMVNVEELKANFAAAAAQVELPKQEETEEPIIVEKIPDPVHTAPAAPDLPQKPRPSRHQAADQSAAEMGLMSDSELDDIIQEFSAEPASTYQQHERLAALEQVLQEDLRMNQSSDFFEEQFGGYAGPRPDPNDIAEPEQPGFFAKLKKMLEEPEESTEVSRQDVSAEASAAPEAPAEDTTPDMPTEAQPTSSSGFKLEIPDDIQPGVPFTLNIPAENIPTEPIAETQTAEPETKSEKAPAKRAAVPFQTKAQPVADAQILDEMGLDDEDDDDEEFFPIRRKKPKKPPVEEAPILTARDGCQKYGSQLKGMKLKVQLSGIVALIAFALTAYYSLDWQFIGFMANGAVMGWILTLLLILSGVICQSVIRDTIAAAQNKQFGLNTLTILAALVSLIDGIIAAIHGRVPYCATASVLLWLSLWGQSLQAEGMYRTMKVLEKNGVHSGIVRSENVYHGKAALFTDDVTEEDFMDHIRKTPLSEQVLQIYTPLAALLTLILAVVAAIQGKANFMQSWAPMLLAAVPVSGLLCYSRTFAVLTKRLAKRGAALCGWYGACALGNNAAVLLRDEDLFPNGMMEPNGVKSFNGYTGNQVIGYAAAVLGKAGSGMAPVLNSLLERDGGRHMQADAIRLYENGGIGGKFGSDAILVGTLGFMRRMGVHMNPEAKVKRATYVSVNGELAGLIAMRYGASSGVKDAMGILTRSGRTKPVMATCNVSITPKLLKQKFRIEPNRVDFPDLRERAELAARSADPDSTICAVMTNAHLATFADAAVGGRILQTVVKVGLIMAIISGLIGICVLGVLSLTGAIAGLSAAYLLLFDLIWLIPVMLLTGWTRSY